MALLENERFAKLKKNGDGEAPTKVYFNKGL